MADITQTLRVELDPEVRQLFDDVIKDVEEFRSEIARLRQEVAELQRSVASVEMNTRRYPVGGGPL